MANLTTVASGLLGASNGGREPTYARLVTGPFHRPSLAAPEPINVHGSLAGPNPRGLAHGGGASSGRALSTPLRFGPPNERAACGGRINAASAVHAYRTAAITPAIVARVA